MTKDELAFLPALELRELIAKREVSPVEVTELFLERIERLDGSLNSYLTVTRELALQSAREAEAAVMRGDDLGPLHGVPVSIKDLEMTAGVRTTSGSLLFKDRVPDKDSAVTRRTLEAGAIMLGKTNTPEFGLLGHTQNRLGDHGRNPWNTDRTPGGSSGGAGASLAAGLCTVASGSDGGGSIRIPSSYCGVYGIKPTQGRVPRVTGAPMLPRVANLFSQSGPMTRTVRDAAMYLQVLAGHDPEDPGSLRAQPNEYMAAADRGVSGLRIGWSADYGYATVDPEVASTCERAARAFDELGCTVEEADVSLEGVFEPFWTLFRVSSYAGVSDSVEGRENELTEYGRDYFEQSKGVSGPEYARALGHTEVLKAQFADLFERYDLLLSPTMATTAFPVGEPPEIIDGKPVPWFSGYTPFTYPINMIGHPAASVPCGLSSEGLPIGLHVVGRFGDESTVIAASAAFEEARPWADARPSVS